LRQKRETLTGRKGARKAMEAVRMHPTTYLANDTLALTSERQKQIKYLMTFIHILPFVLKRKKNLK